ncbi:MAG: RNA methyltransferase [Clostridia bacterium]|nr:RNA methyltransferase [Clostridia bacterium]
MAEYLIGGFISVSAVIENESRELYKLIIDKERQSRISSASYHYPEKAQYEYLNKYLKRTGANAELLSAAEFASLTGGEAYGGIAAIVGDRKYVSIENALKNAKFALMLDGIEDPFNFGYILRTAYACGCDCVLLPERNYFTTSSIVIRSSAGASEMLPIALFKNPSETVGSLKKNGFSMVCTAKTTDSVSLENAKFNLPLCLVIGGEKRGVNKSIMSCADVTVSIDYKNNYRMSLSASSAASILIYGVSSRIK